MRTKTKFKSSNNFRVAFCFSILLCIFGATINFLLFYKNFYKTLSKLNEEPIAQISFKYKTAERRFLERPIWDRLKQFSYLYNGDTVHTSLGAEATVTFIDGNSMFLSESTIAQIFYTQSDSGTSVAGAKLSGGQVLVDSSLSQNGFSLDTSGNILTLESGSKLSATNFISDDFDSQNFSASENVQNNSVQLISGNAKILSSDGSEKSISQGEVLELDSTNVLQNQENIFKPNLTVLFPSPNQKIIYHTEDFCELLFTWKISNFLSQDKDEQFTENFLLQEENFPRESAKSATSENGTSLSLEIFSDRKMQNLVQKENVSFKNSYSLKLPSGTYFYKFTLNQKSQNQNQSETLKSGKFQIIQSLPPVLISPQENHQEFYSAKNPSLRFVWTESPFADYYELQISKDESFESLIYSENIFQTSRTIQTLSDGKYFWRVRPFFRMNNEGFSAVSKISNFTIEKKSELFAPNLLVPKNESFINLEKDAAKIYFSWKSDRNAFEYEFLANDSDDFSNPKIFLTTDKNFISLLSVQNFKSGKWFWKVRMKDENENFSPYSEIRSFYAANGNLEIRTIEPQNNFILAQTFVPDTRFTWKKNLSQDLNTKIFIATDENMQNLVFSSSVPDFGISGIKLKEGEYFWNLGTDENSLVQIFSEPKRLFVVGLLENARLIQPLNRAVVRENFPYEFKWEQVQDADYYRIDIFNSLGELIYSNNIFETSVFLDMFADENFVDKQNYRYEIQARSNAIPGIKSRRSGKISEGSFNLVKLYPVKIDFPQKNMHFNGADAILNPQNWVWSSVAELKTAQVIVSKVEQNQNLVVIKIPTDEEMQNPSASKIAPNKILLDTKNGLYEGNYEIVILAQTTEGFDVSNTDEKYKGKFSIGPIPPLEKVLNLKTEPKKFDTQYFLENASSGHIFLDLTWDKVKDATSYEITIFENQEKNFILKFETSENFLRIDFLSLSEDERRKLQNGIFKWKVDALRKVDSDDDGILDKIFQRSLKGEEQEFEIDVPRMKKSKAKGVLNPYGEN